MNTKIHSIVKLIQGMFKPVDIDTYEMIIDGKPEIFVDVFFTSISDDYLRNPQYHDLDENKKIWLTYDIRQTIQSYLSIPTSGLQIVNGHPYPPRLTHGITISVHLLSGYNPE